MSEQITIKGRIVDPGSQKGLAGLRVEAWDKDFRTKHQIGSTVTGYDGSFSITFDQADYKELFRDAHPDIFFKVYDDDILVKNTEKAALWNVTSPLLEINMEVEEAQLIALKKSYTFQGYVYHLNSNPIVDIPVVLNEVSLGAKKMAGTIKTDSRGYYSITVSARSMSLNRRSPVFQLEVVDIKEKIIAISEILARPQATNEVNFVIDTPELKGQSKFEKTRNTIVPHVEDIKYSDLQENFRQQDISYLAALSGKSGREVEYFVKAQQFAAETEAPPEVFYALFKQGVSPDLDLILAQGKGILKTLEKAAEDNHIPERILEGQKDICRKLNSALVRRIIDEKSGSFLGSVLKIVLKDKNEIQNMLERYTNHEGTLHEYWGNLRKELGAEKVTNIQKVLKLGAITGNQPEMVQKLAGQIGVKTKFRNIKALARLEQNDWEETIKSVSQDAKKLCIPDTIGGENDPERISNYAATIVRILQDAFPTEAFVGGLERDGNPQSPFMEIRDDMKNFFGNNPDFDFRKHPTYTLKRKSTSFNLNNVENEDGLVNTLQAIGRVFNYTPKYQAISALLADGLDAAHRIAEVPRQQYVDLYSQAHGGEIQAVTAYQAAEKTYLQAMELYMQLHPDLNTSTYVTPTQNISAVADPNLRTMFGSMEQCDCEECQTVYSPAAYLADILNFIEKRAPAQVFTELKRRRGDILNIQLTCKNTNTPVPYVDLALERLERLLLNRLNSGVSLTESYQTNGTAQELSANPEYFQQGAYNELKKAVYPAALPFHFPLEETRTYYGHLGVKRAELIRVFMPLQPSAGSYDPDEYNWAVEYLGLSQEEAGVITGDITGTAVTTSEPWAFYGFDSANNFTPIPDPADSQNTMTGNWAVVLTDRVDVFLQQSALSYMDLLYLLNTRYVNKIDTIQGGKVTIVSKNPAKPDTCVLKELRLHNMNSADLGRITKFIRLWKKLGWKMYQLDKVLNALSIQLNNKEDMIKLAYAVWLSDSFHLGIEKVLPFWSAFDSTVYFEYENNSKNPLASLYESLFLNKAVVTPLDPVFIEIMDPTKSRAFESHLEAIGAALQISVDDILLLAKTANIDTAGTTLNLNSLSLLYRHATLSKALLLPVKDYVSIHELIGMAQFAGPAQTYTFINRYDQLKNSVFDLQQLDYLLLHKYSQDSGVAPKAGEVAAFLSDLRTELKKITSPQGQRDLIRQKLAEKLKISLNSTDKLLTAEIKNGGDSGPPLLESFLSPEFMDGSLDIYPEFLLLDKIATLINKLKLTEDELDNLFRYSRSMGMLDPARLPVSTPAAAADITGFLKLIGFVKARDSLPVGSPALFGILTAALNTAKMPGESDSAYTAKCVLAKENWLRELEARTHWGNVVTQLVGDKNSVNRGGLLKASFPEDFQDGGVLLRIMECLYNVRKVGIPADKIFASLRQDLTYLQSQTVKNAAKSKHDETQWYSIAKPLRDQLREKQRAALVAYLVAHPKPGKRQIWKDSTELYEYLLIDVEMLPLAMTSRIKQAISSVQLYIDRVLMNLEHTNMNKTTPALRLHADQVKEWNEWRKLYRIWEANRKVFLYPENWIEPELRDDKSPFFKELETYLMQNDVNTENVADGVLSYLEKLDSVARLEMKGMIHQLDEETDTDIWHVFGRTSATPHKYYYRKRIYKEWTAWEKIELDIEGEQVIPVVWKNRLFLFWLVLTEKSKDTPVAMPATNSSIANPEKCWKIQLAWSEFKKNKWTAKRLSTQSITTPFMTEDKPDDEKAGRLNQYRRSLYLASFTSGDYLNMFVCGKAAADLNQSFYNFRFSSPNGDPDAGPTYYRNFEAVAPEGTYAENMTFRSNCPGEMDPLHWATSYTNITGLITTKDNGEIQAIRKKADKWEPILHDCKWGDYRLTTPTEFYANPLDDAFFYQDSKNTFFAEHSVERVVTTTVIEEEDDGIDLGSLEHVIDDYYEINWEEILDPGGPITNPGHIIVINPLENIKDIISVDQETSIFKQLMETEGTYVSCEGITFKAGSLKNKEYINDMKYAAGQEMSYAVNRVERAGAVYRRSTYPQDTYPQDKYLQDKYLQDRYLQDKYLQDRYSQSSKSSVTVTTYEDVDRFAFHTFYHPHVNQFIIKLGVRGIEGMLDRSVQSVPDRMNFNYYYSPNTDLIKTAFPTSEVDFKFGGAYSQYNWELFFHIPLYIAARLSNNQKFEEARKWFHYIFDPTSSESGGKERFWKFKPFYDEAKKDIQTLDDLMRNAVQLAEQVEKWMNNPFKPHAIARMRVLAYMKNVAMKYIDNLITWADQLFRRDTIESINEATQLYVLAAKILGDRPQRVPSRANPEVQNYTSLAGNTLDEFSNAMVEIENFIQPSGPAAGNSATSSAFGRMAYFTLVKNDKLLQYWDTVADRLFKIRHSMNIEGVERLLPLFEPPIDPAMLVRAAAAGLDLGSVLSDLSAPLPYYRFNIMLQKANEICGDVKALGSALLAALEKKDAEQLALIRQTHEMNVLESIRYLKELQINEAKENMEALHKTKAVTQLRHTYYNSRPFLNSYENTHLESMKIGMILQAVQGGMETVSAVLSAIPNIKIGAPTSMGASFGGSNLGMAMKAFSSYLGIMSGINSSEGAVASTMGGYQRRADDWKFQADSAKKELEQIDKQILAAEIRLAVAARELLNQDLQLENSKEISEFMHSKYTNQELYEWMIGQLSTLYFQSYQLAYDLAKRAQKCYEYELGVTNMSFIQFGYWDSLKKGLLSGEKLQYDLRRMEAAYLEQNKRELELTKHISLVLLAPEALLKLKNEGKCTVKIPEALFDFDYPGHYFRRIKSVSISIPCVAGPYATINCTLRLKNHTIRINTSGTAYEYSGYTTDNLKFRHVSGGSQTIATSSAQNDSGVFELNFRDERYLPFEGCGAISEWDIELNGDRYLRQFDYDTISDAIIHLKYTAREDAGDFKGTVVTALKTLLTSNLFADNPMPLARVFSAKHEFPSQWHRFFNPEAPGLDKVLELPLHKDLFPFFTEGKTINITKIRIAAKCSSPENFEARLSPPFAATDSNFYTLAPSPLFGGLHTERKTAPNGSVNLTENAWKLIMRKCGSTDFNALMEGEVDNIFIVVEYYLSE